MLHRDDVAVQALPYAFETRGLQIGQRRLQAASYGINLTSGKVLRAEWSSTIELDCSPPTSGVAIGNGTGVSQSTKRAISQIGMPGSVNSQRFSPRDLA